MLGGRLRPVLFAVVVFAAMAPQAAGNERATVARMTLEQKVGQVFVPYAYGRSAADPDPAMIAANRALFGLDNFEQVIQKYHVGGFIYYGWSSNLANPPAIAQLSNGLQGASPIPLLVSTDQEQGIVTRMPAPATELPGAMAVGATRKDRFAKTGGAITAKELRAVGINQNFAPVADVNVNPLNPVIGVRSFSSDPDLASRLTSAWTRGTQSEHVAATAKHFPGHGDTIDDSHTTFPEIHHTRAQVDAIDLPPFQAAIDAGTESIMTAHIMVKSLDPSGRPATLSKPILTDLLRDEMGFEGVIVTDSLEMAGVRQMFGDERVPIEAIKAGADMMLRPPKLDVAYNAVLNAVRSGEISTRRIDESVERILRMKRRIGLFRDPMVDESRVASIVGKPAHLREAEEITERTTTLVKNATGTLPLAAGTGAKALVTGSGAATTASLTAQISERGLAGQAFATGSNPSDATIAEAKARGGASDVVVVVTSSVRLSAQQAKLVGEVRATGKPVIAVAVNEPYDIAYYPEVETYLATYGTRAVSLRALAKVLFGEIAPRGRLPVDIPAVGDPSTILFPFGHGLDYD